MEDYLCSCVALHAPPSTRFEILSMLGVVQEWFEKTGLPPDTTAVSAPQTSRKPFAAARLGRRINRIGPSRIEAIELYATQPAYQQLVFGWRVCCTLDKKRGLVVLCTDKRLVDRASLEEPVARILTYGEFRYGYYYERNLKMGPILYADGVAAGLRDEATPAEENAIGKWFHIQSAGQCATINALRDVFRKNLLTDSHLHLTIEGAPLKEWIEASSTRGELKPVAGRVLEWEMSPDRIHEIRTRLGTAGLLACYCDKSRVV